MDHRFGGFLRDFSGTDVCNFALSKKAVAMSVSGGGHNSFGVSHYLRCGVCDGGTD
jgi:hypothetical protein